MLFSQTYLRAERLEGVVEWHLDDHEAAILNLLDSHTALINQKPCQFGSYIAFNVAWEHTMLNDDG